MTNNQKYPIEERFIYDEERIVQNIKVNYNGDTTVLIYKYNKSRLKFLKEIRSDSVLIEEYKYRGNLVSQINGIKRTGKGRVKTKTFFVYNQNCLCTKRSLKVQGQLAEMTTAQYEFY